MAGRVAGAVLAAMLIGGTAAGATLLPSATIRIAPALVPLEARPYEVRPEVLGPETDTIEESVEGTATGTDVETVAAIGTVTFYNWNTVAVEVPAGTSVSADGEVAFLTNDSIVVPHGEINEFGQIVAGEGSMGVVAVGEGPGGNVASEAINSVDDPTVAAFLRGFPTLTERLVINFAETAGGARNERPQVTQADVDAAVTELTQALRRELAMRRNADPDRLYPEDDELPEPEITIPENLVGRVGEASFELSGSVTFSWPYVDRAAAEEAAREALAEDVPAVPEGSMIVPGTTDVRLGDVRLEGTAVVVEATVSAATTPAIDPVAVRERIAGMTAEQATDALADLGDVSVELWPGWVDRVPGFEFRVEVITGAPET
jgi:hypothetical protein